MSNRMILNVCLKRGCEIFLKSSIRNLCFLHFSLSKTLFFVAVFYFSTLNFAEAAAVSGTITQAGEPVGSAEIVFKNNNVNESTKTDAHGKFYIFLEPGFYKMSISRGSQTLGTFWIRSARYNVIKNIRIDSN